MRGYARPLCLLCHETVDDVLPQLLCDPQGLWIAGGAAECALEVPDLRSQPVQGS